MTMKPSQSKSRFSKNVMILTMGTAISQLIPFIVLPILQTYYYGPSDFALLASFVYFSEMIGVMSTFKLEYAIVVQKDEKKAYDVASASLKMVYIMTGFSFLLALVFSQFNIIPGLYALGNLIFLLPLVVLCMGIIQTASYWYNRKQEYKKIANGKVLQTTSSESGKLIFGVAGINFSGLIFGRMLGYISNAIFQGWSFFTDLKKWQSSATDFKKTVKENYMYIVYATPSVFIGGLITFLCIELFTDHYNMAEAGMVSVAITYVSAGLGMVAGSIGQVFYATIAAIHDRKTLMNLYLKFARNLFVMSAFITALFWVLPEEWVVGVLGYEWNDLMDYCRIISLWFGVWFIASSLSFIYMRLNKQGFMLIMDFIHLGMVIVGFFIGKAQGEVIHALWGITIAQVLYYSFAIILALYFIRSSPLLKD